VSEPDAIGVVDQGSGYVLELPADLRRLHDARRFVCDAMAQWGMAPTEDAALLTSEVVSNAMIHVGGSVVLHVRRDGRRAVVEVHDDSSEPPELRDPEPDRPGGRGMHIIEALASNWGVTELHDDGKIVWFEVLLPG
jgi:anti-sigma regulatory factor (Ser/Thr protein kinase)